MTGVATAAKRVYGEAMTDTITPREPADQAAWTEGFKAASAEISILVDEHGVVYVLDAAKQRIVSSADRAFRDWRERGQADAWSTWRRAAKDQQRIHGWRR